MDVSCLVLLLLLGSRVCPVGATVRGWRLAVVVVYVLMSLGNWIVVCRVAVARPDSVGSFSLFYLMSGITCGYKYQPMGGIHGRGTDTLAEPAWLRPGAITPMY
jgi:hypothetical protein